MKRFFFIRHPETEYARSRRFYGSTDIGLSQEGERQAALLIERLALEDIQIVYSSDLYRACHPAHRLAQRLEVQHISLADLREIDFGDWEGHTFEEIERSAPQLCRQWLSLPNKFRFPNGESIRQFSRRIERGYSSLLTFSGQGHDNLAIVTHAGVIRFLLAKIMGLTIEASWQFSLDYGSLTTIIYPNALKKSSGQSKAVVLGKAMVLAVNDVTHL